MEQGGVHAGIGIVEVGNGFLDADAEDALPHAVGDGHGETWMIGGGHPVGELGAQVGVALSADVLVGFFALVVAPGDEFRGDGVSGFCVGILVVVGEFQVIDAGVFDGHAVDAHDVFGLLLEFPVVQAGHGLAHEGGGLALAAFPCAEGVGGAEEGGHFIELALGPVGEGVVVTLGAGDVGSEEGAERQAEVVEPHSGVTQEVTGGAVFQEPAVGGHHGVDHLVPGDVVGDLTFDPVLVGEVADLVGRVGHSHHVGEVVEQVAVIAGGVQQAVDELRAFGEAGVIEEFERLLTRGNAAGEVEEHAADELLVGGERVGLLLGLLQSGFHEHVDARGGLGEVGIGRDAEALGLQRFRCLLINFGEFVQREAIDVAAADLEEDLAVLDAAESGLQLASLRVRPSPIDLVFGLERCEGKSTEEQQAEARFHAALTNERTNRCGSFCRGLSA